MLHLRNVIAAALLATIATPAWPAALSPDDVEAICRVTHAEAAGEPLAGKVAVIEVILNRAKASGMTPAQVVNQPRQFEPVMRAGGDWRRLQAPPPAAMTECLTLLRIKAGEEVAPGATHFQNPAIVTRRARAGEVKANLVDFGGMPVVSEIGGHRFYAGPAGKPKRPAMTSMFAGQYETETELLDLEASVFPY